MWTSSGWQHQAHDFLERMCSLSVFKGASVESFSDFPMHRNKYRIIWRRVGYLGSSPHNRAILFVTEIGNDERYFRSCV